MMHTHYNSGQTATVAPYFERKLDRWKLALLIPLFVLLLAGAVYRQRSWVSWVPQPPASSVANPILESEQPQPPLDTPLQNENAVDGSVDGAIVEDLPAKDNELASGTVMQDEPQATINTNPVRTYSPIQPLPLNNIKGQAPIMPMTLSKPAPGQSLTQNELSILQGTAAAGSTVIINHGQSTGRRADGEFVYQSARMGEAIADADGRWQLWPSTPFSPGDHQLSVTQVDAQTGMQMTFSPVKFTVVASPANASSGLMPIINSPQTAARLSAICAGSSNQRFSGTAMPGWIIQLLINEQVAGEARVGINQAWEIALTQPLAAGSYVARTVLLSPGGEMAAESSPVAFAMYPCQ